MCPYYFIDNQSSGQGIGDGTTGGSLLDNHVKTVLFIGAKHHYL
jgi:hypothetical protein